MSRVKFTVPPALDLPTTLNFCADIQASGEHEEYVFDFAKSRTIEPFGMLLIASEIRKCLATNGGGTLTCLNYEHMSYAGHMGFFKSFGMEFGKDPGEAEGGRNYIPVTILSSAELERRAAENGREVGDEVEAQSKRLTNILTGEDQGDVFETLSYSIREVMRNVVEHAQTDRFGVCAQYWPSKGRAEVAIVDRGIGLRASLAANPFIDASTDKSAINYALMPAVSGKAFKGSRRINKNSPWVNSGFGLYMTSRICRNGGNFFICSGDTGMLLTTGKEGKRYYPTSINGTAARLTIRTDQLSALREALARYREEGYEIQKKYKEIVSIDPSSASLMLSEDFDLSVWDRLLRKLKSPL